jgi:catechol 2,3-dioxygenase-like lactoylglutathione lyase family enzyme
MSGYSMYGTNDIVGARKFYDPLMEKLGAWRNSWSTDARAFYATASGAPFFAVGQPYDGAPATIGNGAMIAFSAPTRALVDQLHAQALALGGTDEGAPGLRGEDPNGFYGAYFRDPDGNKLCIYRVGPP